MRMKQLICSVLLFFSAAFLVSEPVSIPDPKLAKALAGKLGKKPGEEIHAAECTRIFSLDLSSCGISSITGLKYCMNLTSLDLSDNDIREVRGLGNLPNLISLNLEKNSIRLLAPLRTIPLLAELRIAYNRIDDISPLAGLTKLEKLYASHNAISDVTPLSGLTQLKVLNLSANTIKNISALDALSGLEYLELSDNSIQDISAVQHMTDLKYLGLASNGIKDISPVKMVRQIQVFNIQHNEISDLYPLSSCIRLTKLRCHHNNISDIEYISDLSLLEYLDCSHNRIRSIDSLKGCRHLKYLNVSRNRITDITVLSALKDLRILDLSENRIRDISSLETLENIGVGRKKESVHISLASNRILDVSPLVRNRNLEKGVGLNISNNPIADRNRSIQALRKKGLTVISFYLRGESEIKEGEAVQIRAVEMVGSTVTDISAHCTWRVLRGGEYAAFDRNTPGRLINTNASGKKQRVVIQAEDTRKGKKKKAYALLRVESSPRFKEIIVNGTDALREESTFQYYAFAVWEGKDNVNITEKAAWSISGGGEYAEFDKDIPGKLIHTNTSGMTQTVVIRCAYKHGAKEYTAAKQVKMIDIPTITSVSIEGPASIARGAGGAAYRAVCHWNGKADEDITEAVRWSFKGKAECAHFSPERKGYLVHKNTTGQDCLVTVLAAFKQRRESWKSEKRITLTDNPYITAVSVIGPAKIGEDGSAALALKAEWKGKGDTRPGKGVVWKLVKGGDHAQLDVKSGVLKNTNRTGSPAEAVVSAEYTGGGVTLKNSRRIVLEDSHFVRGVVINGPAVLKEDGTAEYSAVVQWAGRADEKSPQGISWDISEGAEHVQSSGKAVLSLTNKSRAGKDCTAVIRAEYRTGDDGPFSSEKRITVKDSPFITGIRIDGPDTLEEGKSHQYTATVLWKGAEDREETKKAAWKIEKGKKWIKLDPEKPGHFTNINSSGRIQEAEISAVFFQDIDMHSGTITVTAADSPFAVGIKIQGPETVPERKSSDLTVKVELSDGTARDGTADAEWSIVGGKEYAGLETAHPGRIVNRNQSGSNEDITVAAVYK